MSDQQNYIDAIKDFDIAIELNPKLGESYFERGVAKHKLQDINGAYLDWSKAKELGFSKASEKIKKIL